MQISSKEIKINNFIISNDRPFTLIAGPCVLESYDHALFMATKLKDITDKLGISFIYKSSFDKANRTSLDSSRGPGLSQSLKVFRSLKEELGCNIITDVHEINQIKEVADVVDIIQIPAFLCRQTDLLVESAKGNKPVMVKKGQFLAPWDMKNVAEKLKSNVMII